MDCEPSSCSCSNIIPEREGVEEPLDVTEGEQDPSEGFEMTTSASGGHWSWSRGDDDKTILVGGDLSMTSGTIFGLEPCSLERKFTLLSEGSRRVRRMISVKNPREPDVGLVAVAEDSKDSEHFVRVYDVGSGSNTPIVRLGGNRGEVMALHCLPETNSYSYGPRIIAGDNNSGTTIHDLFAGKLLHSLQTDRLTRGVLGVAGIENDSVYIGGSDLRRAAIYEYEMTRGSLVGTFVKGQYPVSALTMVQGKDRTLYSSSADRRLRVWDVKTYQCVSEIMMTERVMSVYFAEDRGLIIFGNYNGAASVWDPRFISRRFALIESLGGGVLEAMDRIDEDTFVTVSTSRDVTTWSLGKQRVLAKVGLPSDVMNGALYGVCFLNHAFLPEDSS